jgi:hypothetical protein
MRCKPGDMAFVIQDDVTPDNVGRVVKVHELIVDHPFIGFDARPLWRVSARDPLTVFDPSCQETAVHDWGYCADNCLQPIRPPAVPLSITTTAPDVAHA